MGYGVYWVEAHSRFAGYGVPCACEHPDCKKKISRGLAHLCGETPGGSETGCGLYFCGEHLYVSQQCERCKDGKAPFDPKPDTRPWIRHMLRDATWQQWRDENPAEVEIMKQKIAAKAA